MVTTYEPLLKEENFKAMEDTIKCMITEKSTDVDFDESKIDSYEVMHKENGNKVITISGVGTEELFCVLNEEYEITEMIKTGYLFAIFIYLLCIVVYFCIGCIITLILWMLYILIKKVINFLK